jgi:hypothetical protein
VLNIFKQEKTVVGLFNNDQDIERAVNNLYTHGFDENEDSELTAIDLSYLSEFMGKISATPVTTAGVNNSSNSIVREDSATSPDSNTTFIPPDLKEALIDLGVGHKEIAFFTQQAAHGGALIVIKTSEEQIQEALKIMKQANARTFIS